MKHLFFAIMALVCFNSFSQNWAPVIPGNISAFYKYMYGTYAIKVDSVTINGSDSTLHFYKTWNHNSGCIMPDGPSWLGSSATIKVDRSWTFYNYQNEPLTILPVAEVDSSWVFYSFPNGDKVISTVVQKELEEILGFEDSIKTITIALVNAEDVPILPNPYSNLSIKIGKNLGFVSVFPLRHFNEVDLHYYDIDLVNFSVEGISIFKLGESVLTNALIYSYELNDEFHYYFEASHDNYVGRLERNQIKIVIEKEIIEEEGKIRYLFSIQNHDIYTNSTNPSQNYNTITNSTQNTYVNVINSSICFPEEVIIDENLGFDGYSQGYWENNRRKISRNDTQYYYYDYENCWGYPVKISKYGSWQTSVEGIGVVSSSTSYGNDEYSDDLELKYYKKGDETWGTPLVITSTTTFEANKLNVYPNPVKAGEMVYIEGATSQLLVSITTTAGELVKNVKVNSSENGIVIPKNTSAGIYFITLQGNGAERIVRKVIVLN